MQHEWSKHQKLAVDEFKRGLSSYCQIGSSNLKLQMTIMERLQVRSDWICERKLFFLLAFRNLSINSLRMTRTMTIASIVVYQISRQIAWKLGKKSMQCYEWCSTPHRTIHRRYRQRKNKNFSTITSLYPVKSFRCFHMAVTLISRFSLFSWSSGTLTSFIVDINWSKKLISNLAGFVDDYRSCRSTSTWIDRCSLRQRPFSNWCR